MSRTRPKGGHTVSESRGRNLALAMAMVAAAVSGASACNVSEKGATRPEEAIRINPCDVVEREEAERAVGLPLPIERLQLIIFDGTPNHYCQWLDGDDVTGDHHGWSEFTVEPERTTVAEHQDDADRYGRIDGLGELAWWSQEATFANLSVITPAGARIWMSVDLPAGMTPDEEQKARLVELMRAVVPRVDAELPGDGGTLPEFPQLSYDLCDIVPPGIKERILGWRGGRQLQAHLGGHFGGHWRCSGSSEGRSFSFAVTVDPVAAPDLARVGAPIDDLDRPAHFRGAELSSTGGYAVTAAIGFIAGDGRLVVLELRDKSLDEAGYRRVLVDLARAALPTTG